MKRTVQIIRILSVVGLIGFCTCKTMLESDYNASVGKGSGQTVLKPSDFVITNQISGWTQDASGSASYNDPISLQNLIDGGYNVYTDNGMIEGIQEVMATSDGKGNRIWVMDFGTPDKATAMYQFEKTSLTGRKTNLDYPDTTAIAKVNLSSITAHAHFGRFYFQMALSNYTPATAAIQDGNLFLEFYEAKANEASGN